MTWRQIREKMALMDLKDLDKDVLIVVQGGFVRVTAMKPATIFDPEDEGNFGNLPCLMLEEDNDGKFVIF